jgi:hypothetical protein
VAVFILGYIHHEPRDRPNRNLRSRTVAGPILILLVIGFPTPPEFEARALTVLGHIEKPLHGVVLHVASRREFCLDGKQPCNRAQGYSSGKE